MYENLKDVINFFVEPFLSLIRNLGLESKIIKIGFGEVEWFSFELLELTELILSGLVMFLFIRVVFRLMRVMVRMITGGNYL